jgi:hypothetical protein
MHSLRLDYSNLHPKNQIGTYLKKQRVHTKKSKNKKPTNENAGTDKNEPGSKQKHLWLIQSWCWTMVAGPLIDLFKMNPHQHQRSRLSQRKIKTTRTHSLRSQKI